MILHIIYKHNDISYNGSDLESLTENQRQIAIGITKIIEHGKSNRSTDR